MRRITVSSHARQRNHALRASGRATRPQTVLLYNALCVSQLRAQFVKVSFWRALNRVNCAPCPDSTRLLVLSGEPDGPEWEHWHRKSGLSDRRTLDKERRLSHRALELRCGVASGVARTTVELHRRGGGSVVLKPDHVVVRLAEVLGAVQRSRAVCGSLAVPTGEAWMALTDPGRNAVGG